VLERPAWNDAKGYFGTLEGYDETFGWLADFLLEILEQLSCVGGLFHVNSLGFGLQNAVLVYEDESHLGCWDGVDGWVYGSVG
jgi:hypothetical protein